MKKLHIVYDCRHEALIPAFSMFFLVFVLIGLAVFFYTKYNADPDEQTASGGNKRKFGMYFSLGFAGFGLSLFCMVVASKFASHRVAENMFGSGKYKVIEGPVINYHPMPAEGHDTERFDIGTVHFEMMDYAQHYGYNVSASHGGVIQASLYVKIVYARIDDQNAILQLQTE